MYMAIVHSNLTPNQNHAAIVSIILGDLVFLQLQIWILSRFSKSPAEIIQPFTFPHGRPIYSLKINLANTQYKWLK